MEIPGIDVEIALKRLGGDPDIYRAVLKLYVGKMPAELEGLRNVAEESLARYSVTIHGIKGNCASIGAMELREKAERLESASKAGDLSAVLAENGEFLEDIEKLVSDIRNWLEGSPQGKTET